MNSYKKFLVGASLLSCALLSFNAQAQIPFNVTPTYDPSLFGTAGGGWTSGDVTLPDGTTIGSTPLELDLTLSQNITLTSVGLGYNYRFGMNGFNPLLQLGGDAFTFSIELLEDGTLVTPDFATDLANPFTFGFDETSPWADTWGLSVSTSTTALASSLTFDQMDILISNSNPGGEGVTDFTVDLGVLNPAPVPDNSNTLPLFFMGALGMMALGWRKAVKCQQVL